MKKFKLRLLVCLVLVGISKFGMSQTFNYVSESEYAALKVNGQLTGNEVIQSEGMVTVDPADIYQEFIITPKAQGCGGYFDPPGPPVPLSSQDDGSTNNKNPYALPFDFCFFGDTYNRFWVNANGNVSFDTVVSTFTSTAFPSTGIGSVLLAPFWADLDFTSSGTVHGTITPTAVVVNWVDAGYFSSQSDKLNTFQLVFTDGTDPLVQGGNVAFHYKDMQWTTGSASGGTNGFGGTPATAGANRGNNVDFFQIGQFDHEGVDYDGPNGANDGVSWLDNKSFYFDFCSVGNVPPIPLETQYCDTFTVCSIGDTTTLVFPFLSPEVNQTTTVTYSAPTLNNVNVVSSTSGVTGELILEIYGAQETIGVHTITVTATDDFVPAGQTVVTYTLEVTDGDLAFPIDPILDFTTQCAPMTFSVLNGPYDSYLWETTETTSTIDINNYFSETLSVTVEQGGCKFRIDSLVYVPAEPIFNLTGDLIFCTNPTGTFLEIPDSTQMGSITWGLSDPIKDAHFSNYLQGGTYTLSAWDSLNICSNDTTFTVTEIPQPQIFSDTIGCFHNYFVNGTVSATGGIWSAADTSIHFMPNANIENPLINTSTPGTYTVSYTDNTCNTTLTAEIYYPDYPWTWVFDTTICVGGVLNITVPDENVDATDYTWSNGAVGTSVEFSEPGYYEVTLTNVCHTASSGFNLGTKNCFIEAPNVISLSPGSLNPIWYVDFDGIKDYELTITNRWGNVVFKCDENINLCGWNGKDKSGNEVDEGTYFYIINAKTEGNEEVQKHGFIQVVK